jgi:hypothetical protein
MGDGNNSLYVHHFETAPLSRVSTINLKQSPDQISDSFVAF